MTAERLLRALSAQTGVRLACAPETRGEVLLLHVRSVPLSEVMARLAEAASAKWVPAKGGFRLTRPKEVDQAQRLAEIAERARWLRRGLDRYATWLDGPLDPAKLVAAAHYREEFSRFGKPMPDAAEWMDPAYRLLARCLREIGPEGMAAIPPWQFEVWATDPTPLQHPLGGAVRAAMHTLIAEQQTFGEVLKKAGVTPGREDGPLRRKGDPAAGAAPQMPWERLSPYPEPARIVVRILRASPLYSWDMVALDPRGRTILNVSYGGSVFGTVNDLQDELSSLAEASPQASGPPVPFSLASWLLAKALARNPDGTGPAGPALATVLTHPEEHDPLSLVVSDGYLAVAQQQHLNLAACLPDRLLDSAYIMLVPGLTLYPGRVTVADLARWPRFRTPMRLARRGGWLVVTPPDPYESRWERLDRRVLGAITRCVARDRRISIEDEASFLARAGARPDETIARLYFSLAAGRETPVFYGRIARLYGALDARQRRLLFAGRQINFGSLSARQRRLAEQLVYRARSYPLVGTTGASTGTALADEPTDVFPHGLPPERGMRGAERQQHRVEFLEPDASPAALPYWTAFVEEPPEAYDGWAPAPKGGFGALRYRFRRMRTVHFEVDISPWSCGAEDFHEASGPPAGPPVPLDQLPPDVREGVERWLRWLRRRAGEGR
jgi:hypothetical protein